MQELSVHEVSTNADAVDDAGELKHCLSSIGFIWKEDKTGRLNEKRRRSRDCILKNNFFLLRYRCWNGHNCLGNRLTYKVWGHRFRSDVPVLPWKKAFALVWLNRCIWATRSSAESPGDCCLRCTETSVGPVANHSIPCFRLIALRAQNLMKPSTVHIMESLRTAQEPRLSHLCDVPFNAAADPFISATKK
jgi:hypothetical protein